jgi:glycosyltransferase involved in cell wall biosynthesis
MTFPSVSPSRLLQIVSRRSIQQVQAALSLFHGPSYSLLSIHSDLSGWVLDEETVELQRLAAGLGIDARINYGLSVRAAQCCHYTSQFVLRTRRFFETRNRVSVDYFHGLPGTTEVFTEVYDGLRRRHATISRVRVSHSKMEQVVLDSGIDPGKVHRIPIGISLDHFTVQTSLSRQTARRKLGLPESAIVIGSFQKDGVGWGEGREPKLIKGPDVFLRTIELLKLRVPELCVLLSGPSRGYVKDGLARLGVPYRHVFPKYYQEIGRLFQALDIYLVTSRDEGGPKAVLESMASGIPLVTTRVGQAVDLVQHETNGWVVDVEDAEGIVHWAEYVLGARNQPAVREVLLAGRATAEANTYNAQEKQWREFFRGYVEIT